MCHYDNHIALFVSLFYIAMCFSHLFQRIASVDHRFEFSGFNQLCQEGKVFDLVFSWSQTCC